MYKCCDCESKFDEPVIVTENTGVIAPDGTAETHKVSVCPYCGWDVYEPVRMCKCCGDDEALHSSDFCNVCLLEIQSAINKTLVELAKGYGTDKDTIEDAMFEIFYEK